MRALSDDRILNLAAEWYQSGHDLAIAVVIQTWGSSPRPRGSIMIIRDDNQMEGSVSGGCVESSVIEAAHHVMADATANQLDFHVVDEGRAVGLSCGGLFRCGYAPPLPWLITRLIYSHIWVNVPSATRPLIAISAGLRYYRQSDQPASTLSDSAVVFIWLSKPSQGYLLLVLFISTSIGTNGHSSGI